MSDLTSTSRRSFLKKALGTAIITGSTPLLADGHSGKIVELTAQSPGNTKHTSNDQINIAAIGMGIMGFSNVETSLQVPGVKLVGVCDLYTGRLDHAKELYGP